MTKRLERRQPRAHRRLVLSARHCLICRTEHLRDVRAKEQGERDDRKDGTVQPVHIVVKYGKCEFRQTVEHDEEQNDGRRAAHDIDIADRCPPQRRGAAEIRPRECAAEQRAKRDADEAHEKGYIEIC